MRSLRQSKCLICFSFTKKANCDYLNEAINFNAKKAKEAITGEEHKIVGLYVFKLVGSH